MELDLLTVLNNVFRTRHSCNMPFIPATLHSARIRYGLFSRKTGKSSSSLTAKPAYSKKEERPHIETQLADTEPYLRRLGKRPAPAVSQQGTKRQRMYYQHEFGANLSRQQVDSKAYYRAAKQDFMTMIRCENMGPPNGMLTFVGNDQTADIRTMLRQDLGPLADIPPEDHIKFMFKSQTKRAQKTPVYLFVYETSTFLFAA
jgi:hypothetical protein